MNAAKQRRRSLATVPKKCRGAQDCLGSVFCKNLCQSHYMREWYARGTKSGTRWCQKPSTTGFQGFCGKKVHRSNLCNVHWRQAPTCKQAGCRRRVVLLGNHCPRHIQKTNSQKISSLCIINKCQRFAMSQRLCRRHYDKIKWEKKRRTQAVRRRPAKTSRKEQVQIQHLAWIQTNNDDNHDNDDDDGTACLRYVFESTDQIASWNHLRHQPP